MSIAIGMVITIVKAPHGECERVHHDEGDHGEEDDHDPEHGDHGEETGPAADLVAGDLTERALVAPEREEEDDEVLHAFVEHRADHEPQRPGQVAELGC
jgi:hypothetical protein